jgi:hypothetical protein
VRPHRRLDDPDIDRGEHGIEGGGELGVAVADEEPEPPMGLVEVDEQVAGLLGEPLPGPVRGDAQDMDAQGGVLDDEERVQGAVGLELAGGLVGALVARDGGTSQAWPPYTFAPPW